MENTLSNQVQDQAQGPVKETEFSREVGGLGYQEERLKKIISQLESKLNAVLRSPTPEGNEKTDQLEPITQIGKIIRQIKNKIFSDCDYLDGIIRRLEI